MVNSPSAKRRRRLGLCVVLVLASCDNPLRVNEDEYGRRIDDQKLRTARPMRLSEHALEKEDVQLPELKDDQFASADSRDVSIEQGRAWTLANNLDLKVALIDPKIANTLVNEEEARFESLFVTRGTISDADEGQSRVFPDEFVRPFDVEPGVEIPLVTGGSLGIALPMSREETFDGFDAFYSSDVQVSLRHPLFRNSGRRTNTHRIRIAALESQIAQAQTKLEVIRQIAELDRAYWRLWEAHRILEVRRTQLGHAQLQLNHAQAKLDRGIGPQIEVDRASAGLSRRRASIVTADLVVRIRQRELKRIMNHPDLDVDSTVTVNQTTSPVTLPYQLSPPELIAAALDERMDLLELELRLAQDLSTIDFAENQKLPLFALDYAYRFDGEERSFGDALDGLADGESTGWRLGVDIQVPLGNEAAESRYHRAILTRLQRLSTRAAREQAVKQEVLAALDSLRHSWYQIIVTEKNVELEARLYEAEKGQYALGLRNSTDVLDAESRLSDAKADVQNAILDYQIAQIDLAFATGMLLGAARTTW